MRNIILFFVILLCSRSYSQIKYGKNLVMTSSEGVEREYVVHVPMTYDGSQPVPLIFMLHGTSGSGPEFYENIGWKELSETENFIVVYPSSLRYKIIDEEGPKVTTKWNTPPDANFVLQPGEVGKDDIKFLRKVIDEITEKYNIDNRRIYLNGFSNGGNMAAKCAIEMGDVLAAVCQNASSFSLDTHYVIKRKLPVLYQTGDKDYGPGNQGPPVPMHLFDTLISTPGLPYKNGKFYEVAHLTQRHFDLLSEHTITGDSNFALVATFLPKPNTGGYEYKFVLVKNLAHNYPNGVFHPFDAPKIHWNWMKQYSLDESTSAKTLTVNNGYGDGNYEKDEKIHVRSEQQDGKVFTHWTGDTEYLESPFEYHTTVNMPDKNISVTAQYADIGTTMRMIPLPVKGAERTKNIQIYLPQKDKLKGVVWFLHGTNGNATNMVYDIEVKQMIDRLMTLDYGIIGITSEESEYNLDFDGDGNRRWTYGIDSNLVDFANIRAIRDTLIGRGRIDGSTKHIAYGYSAGGAFAELVVNVLNWRAAINHNAPSSEPLSLEAIVPYIISISENDRHPDVGAAANAQSKINIKNYTDRNICATLLEHKKSPLYPERFDRSPLISEQQSIAIFNEIKNNNNLDANNNFINFSDALSLDIIANPQNYPVIVNLTNAQKAHLENQIDVTNAEHNVKADFNGYLVDFIQNLCGTTSTEDIDQQSLFFFPNPSSSSITFEDVLSYEIYDMTGKLMLKGISKEVDVEGLKEGIYIVRSGIKAGKLVR